MEDNRTEVQDYLEDTENESDEKASSDEDSIKQEQVEPTSSEENAAEKTGWLDSIFNAEQKQRRKEQEKGNGVTQKDNSNPVTFTMNGQTVYPPGFISQQVLPNANQAFMNQPNKPYETGVNPSYNTGPAYTHHPPYPPHTVYSSGPAVPYTNDLGQRYHSPAHAMVYYPPVPAQTAAVGITAAAPSEDKTKPLSVVCSRSMSETEYRFLNKKTGFFAKRVWTMAVVSAGLFCISVVLALSKNELSIVWPFITLGMILCFAGIVLMIWNFNHLVQKEYARKKITDNPESVIEFYSDRVMDLSANKQVTMPLSSVRIVIEANDLLALMDAMNHCIVIRAEDLTPFDVKWIRRFVYQRLGKVMRIYKGELTGKRYEPLPIPIIDMVDETMMAFPLSKAYSGKKNTADIIVLLTVLLAVGLLWGTISANIFWITNSIIADVFIHMGIITAVIVMVLALLIVIAKGLSNNTNKSNKIPSGVSFTKRGMVVGCTGFTEVIPWRMLKFREIPKGICFEMQTDKDSWPVLTVLREQIPDYDALIAILQQQSVKYGG